MKKGLYLVIFEENNYSRVLFYKGRGIVDVLCGDYYEWEELNIPKERDQSFRDYLQLCRENGYKIYFLGA